MSTIQQTRHQTPSLPAGVWRLDPATAELRFQAGSMWGLVRVRGRFTSSEGTLQVDDAGVAAGELTIDAASLDTRNKRRDQHLRSADFFDVEQHPTIRFAPHAVTSGPDGVTITGDLQVGATVTTLQLPVTVSRPDDDRLRLQTSTTVPREDVGLTWNRAGMIRGDARLDVEIDLVRVA